MRGGLQTETGGALSVPDCRPPLIRLGGSHRECTELPALVYWLQKHGFSAVTSNWKNILSFPPAFGTAVAYGLGRDRPRTRREVLVR
jgi:hypothetical protein